MDYSLGNACAAFVKPNVNEFVLLYDMVCQYYINLATRVNHSLALKTLFASIQDAHMVKGIRLFYVHGHKTFCLPQFSSDCIQGIRVIDSKIIETLWMILNEVS